MAMVDVDGSNIEVASQLLFWLGLRVGGHLWLNSLNTICHDGRWHDHSTINIVTFVIVIYGRPV